MRVPLRRWWAVHAVGAILVMAMLSSCSAAERETSPPPRPTAQSAAPPVTLALDECIKAQRREARRLAFPWWMAADEVIGLATGLSATAGAAWARAVRVAGERVVTAGCPDPPLEMAELLRRSAAMTRLRVADLPALIHALRGWVSAIGSVRSPLDSYLSAQEHCLQHREDIARVSYTVDSQPIAGGREVWIVMRIENLTARRLDGSLGGSLRIHGALPGTEPTARWGGSSSDFVVVPPSGTAQIPMLSVRGERFRVAPGGRLSDIAVRVNMYAGAGSGCPFPAMPAG